MTLRFVGVEGGFGRMLGLVDMGTLQAIRAAGNYAEIYEQNPGVEAQLSIPRDLIQLWSIGGVLYAAPIR